MYVLHTYNIYKNRYITHVHIHIHTDTYERENVQIFLSGELKEETDPARAGSEGNSYHKETEAGVSFFLSRLAQQFFSSSLLP